jgi:cyclopropane fatty-acyl-phospholipid synthase-like methyltransferase
MRRGHGSIVDPYSSSVSDWDADAAATDWRAVFEDTYSTAASPTEERIWREVLGDEYPEGIDPYSYLTMTELKRFADEVHVGPGETLVDVGCGRGGAALWVASATGAELIGIDIAESALVAARERASAMGRAATFQRGEFEATGLGGGSADAVMSVDALLFTPSKEAATVELRRILRPGGRLVLTSWDYHSQPVGRPPQVADHRPLVEAAGFKVLAYDTTVKWREHAERIGQGLLASVEELAAESGRSVDDVRSSVMQMNATLATMIRRFFLVAEANRQPR